MSISCVYYIAKYFYAEINGLCYRFLFSTYHTAFHHPLASIQVHMKGNFGEREGGGIFVFTCVKQCNEDFSLQKRKCEKGPMKAIYNLVHKNLV